MTLPPATEARIMVTILAQLALNFQSSGLTDKCQHSLSLGPLELSATTNLHDLRKKSDNCFIDYAQHVMFFSTH